MINSELQSEEIFEEKTKPKPDRVSEIKLSLSELMVLTDLSPKTLNKRLGDIEPIDGAFKSKLYPLKKAVQAIYVIGIDSVTELDISQKREEIRLTSARASKIEMENAVREKKLVPADDAINAYSDHVIKFKSKLLAIPSKAAHLLASILEPAQIQEALTQMIHEALDELSDSSFSANGGASQEAGGSKAV